MPDAEKPEPRIPQSGFVIDPKWRWLATVLGLGGLGAGGYATFTTDVEGGPVAMLLIGLVFMFIAMSGRLPNRLKIGDNDVTWQGAVEDYVAETITSATPQEKSAEIQRASELASVAPEVAARAIGKAALHDAASEMVVSVVNAMPDAHLRELATGYSGRQLLLVEGDKGGRVLINIRSSDAPKSLFTEAPRHWAILYIRLEPGPAEHLNLVTRPAATFVYQSDNKFSRDSLRGLIEKLLAASAERETEIAKGDELIKHFSSGK